MIIIVDSDGLIGLSQEEDAHYSGSVKLLKKLNKENAKLISPATTIAEAVSILQIRLNKQDTADQIMDAVESNLFYIEPIDQMILAQAISFLGSGRSKHHTLFDGVVAAVARKYQVDAIFSFDKFYKTKGFTLASEL